LVFLLLFSACYRFSKQVCRAAILLSIKGRRAVGYRRHPLPFRRSDIKRAVIAARAANLSVQRIDINRDGGFSLLVVKPLPVERELTLTDAAVEVLNQGRVLRQPPQRGRKK
jgi:hypothetical protein